MSLALRLATLALEVLAAAIAAGLTVVVVTDLTPPPDPPPVETTDEEPIDSDIECRQDPIVIDTADTGDSAETGGDRG